MTGGFNVGPLNGIRVLDLSRILAGPTCTQLLGDLGAEVIKIENPKGGDDTRTWGPPFVTDPNGDPSLSSYFMCANRNKFSVTVDIATDEGQRIIKALAAQSDIVIENFKPGGLKKYGLDAETLCDIDPALIYCSISGYGQTGPNAHKPGYDLMAQGYGGIMSLTGEPEGEPMKVGVGIADVMCGMYATVGILAALRHRDQTGDGQQIDLSLVDSQVAWLINEGTGYLTTGKRPIRRGNGHPNIAPYQVFATSDGHVIVAVGNDSQFRRFCTFLSLDALPEDDSFANNSARLNNRDALIDILTPVIAALTTDAMIKGLEESGVPVGPVQTLDQVFASDQVAARDMMVEMQSQAAHDGSVRLIGNPLKFSATPVTYRRSPPQLGQDTAEILARLNVKP
ncbi:CaiB/BaiF CoA transferase family protein [Yoonia sp. 2307UL14-13]|uniref:CaiB/BaiF CoA transferase family protein n=1 Tax=Yoonia sp. 2307UL14-13 TaxID=3126506 RepID=UPI0030EDCBEB